jgi:hypothetical protein
VEGDRELYRAEARSQVAPGLGDDRDDLLSYLPSQLLKLFDLETFKVLRPVDVL